jgi:arginyl-tRNA synthetase
MFRSLLTQRLQTAFQTKPASPSQTASTPAVVLASDTRYGDYQSNAPMVLAKQMRTNPRALAQQIVDALDVTDLCEKTSASTAPASSTSPSPPPPSPPTS